MSDHPTRFIFSVDVEDYFQVEAFAREVSRSDWGRWPTRVVANTHRTLDLCDEYNTKGTYFILGWVADRFPELVREIRDRGHEVACHSYWHRPVYSLTPQTFRDDLRQARDVLQQAAGTEVVGYRAPSWSITTKSMWALDVLAEEGFLYDSSIYPIRHDIYGVPGAKRVPYTHQLAGGGTLQEYPPATVKLGSATLPAAGGGYLRILPLWYTRWAVERLRRESSVVVVYLHPWEIDPEQPRIHAGRKSRFRHYTNLSRMESRLRSLLGQYSFEPFRQLMSTHASL